MRTILPVLAALLAASTAHGLGTASVSVLNKVEATRAQAFGGAAVALGNDPTLAWINPAAPSQTAGSALTIGGQRGYFGDMTGQGLYTTPWRTGMFTVGLLYYDGGEVRSYTEDGTAWSARLQQDILASAGYSMQLSPNVSSGAALKYMQSSFIQKYNTSTIAADGGIQVRMSNAVKLGFAVSNIGFPMKYGIDGDSTQLPTTARAGIAAGSRFGGSEGQKPSALIAVMDAEYRIEDGYLAWKGGLEFQWRGLIALRGGVRLGNRDELSMFSLGTGLRIGAWRLDYTLRYNREANLPQTISLTVALPGSKGATTAPPAAMVVPALPQAATIPDTETEVPTNMFQPSEALAPAMPDDNAEFTPPPPSGEETRDGQKEVIEDLNRRLDQLMEDYSK